MVHRHVIRPISARVIDSLFARSFLPKDLRICHFDGWISELLYKILIEQSPFELIDGFACLVGNVFEAHPYQHGASDVVALDTSFSTLAFFEPRDLLEFSVKLLDLPSEAALLSCSLRGVLSDIVGDDVIRSVGRDRHSE